ncbi:hypothetical protein F5879DRAFT_940362 [Lentinula edodes]|nr:hypothetical protein F5879DRAFT_940362 [Lentinula edodes]
MKYRKCNPPIFKFETLLSLFLFLFLCRWRSSIRPYFLPNPTPLPLGQIPFQTTNLPKKLQCTINVMGPPT